MKFHIATAVVGILLLSCGESADDESNERVSKGEESYRSYFERVTGHDGPVSKFGFSYARPTEFYTIGWLKVEEGGATFRGKNVFEGEREGEADKIFYLYEHRAVCPPKEGKYFNHFFENEDSEFWFAFDPRSGFLWFVEQLKVS